MTYWYRMNVLSHGKNGAYIVDENNERVSPKFDNTMDLWRWIDKPECPFVYDQKDEDGTFVPFRMKLK